MYSDIDATPSSFSETIGHGPGHMLDAARLQLPGYVHMPAALLFVGLFAVAVTVLSAFLGLDARRPRHTPAAAPPTSPGHHGRSG